MRHVIAIHTGAALHWLWRFAKTQWAVSWRGAIVALSLILVFGLLDWYLGKNRDPEHYWILVWGMWIGASCALVHYWDRINPER